MNKDYMCDKCHRMHRAYADALEPRMRKLEAVAEAARALMRGERKSDHDVVAYESALLDALSALDGQDAP